MMCFDLGGPVNKAAYAFAIAGLNVADPASLRIMAAVMAAGMVPPLAMALATAVRPGLFTEPERENGRAAWLLGASFISEGAIPFAAADPLRVIPSMMAGGAVTGALIMAFDVTLEGAARRHLRVLRDRQPAVVPGRAGRRHRRRRRRGGRRQTVHRQVRRRAGVGHPAPHNLATSPKRTFGRKFEKVSPNVDLGQPTEGAHDMHTKTVIVGSAIGLHARPAAIISEAAVNAGVPVTLSVDGGEPVDAGSALMIMTLGAGNGAQVTVASEDEAACNQHRRAGAEGSRRLSSAQQHTAVAAPLASAASLADGWARSSAESGYLRKWLILGVAIGIIAGLGAVVFYLALKYTTEFLLGYLGGYDVPTAYGDGGDPARPVSSGHGRSR